MSLQQRGCHRNRPVDADSEREASFTLVDDREASFTNEGLRG
jgi:hypothetical protein